MQFNPLAPIIQNRDTNQNSWPVIAKTTIVWKQRCAQEILKHGRATITEPNQASILTGATVVDPTRLSMIMSYD
jgi:hypothetical protein